MLAAHRVFQVGKRGFAASLHFAEKGLSNAAEASKQMRHAVGFAVTFYLNVPTQVFLPVPPVMPVPVSVPLAA